jgi:uncharacterized protein
MCKPTEHVGHVLKRPSSWTEIRRRHREFARDEAMLQQQQAQQQHEDDDDETTLVADADNFSAFSGHTEEPPRARQTKPRVQSEDWGGATEAIYSEAPTAYDTDAFGPTANSSHRSSLAKPTWLLDAEEAVQKHLGPGRSSHDFLHADRTRRGAMHLAKHVSRRTGLDTKVIEISALFISACNDPKHPVKDAKEFVVPWSMRHHGAVTQEQVDLIVRICRTVSVKKEERRKREKRETDWHRTCLELHVVQDADKLEQLGCIGILRTAASYGTSHKPLFDCSDPTQALQSIKPGNSVAHFVEKEKLLGLCRTPEGKKLAQRRYQCVSLPGAEGFADSVAADECSISRRTSRKSMLSKTCPSCRPGRSHVLSVTSEQQAAFHEGIRFVSRHTETREAQANRTSTRVHLSFALRALLHFQADLCFL